MGELMFWRRKSAKLPPEAVIIDDQFLIRSLFDALKLLWEAERRLQADGFICTPQWNMLSSAQRHLNLQADRLLRPEKYEGKV